MTLEWFALRYGYHIISVLLPYSDDVIDRVPALYKEPPEGGRLSVSQRHTVGGPEGALDSDSALSYFRSTILAITEDFPFVIL